MKKTNKLLTLLLSLFMFMIILPQNVVHASTSLPLKYSIDFVRYNQTTKSVEIQGWALSGSGIQSVIAIVDGKTNALNTTYRPDVYNAFPQYNNKYSGFNKVIPITISNTTTSKVYIKITEKNGAVTTLPITTNIPSKELRYCLDFAKYNGNTKTLNIQGWALSGYTIKSVVAEINGQSYTLSSAYRPDVYKAYPQYNNAYGGFNKIIPLNLAINSSLIVNLKITEGNGKITTLPVEVNNSIINTLKTIDSNSQVILVTSNGYGTSSARIRTFEKINGNYKQILDVTGYIGKYGFAEVMSEGGMKSPRGKYTIGTTFGRYGNPGTKMPFRNITYNDYWVDDSYSPYYNTWQVGPSNGRWNSAESMNIAAYNYGFVINYNTVERIPGKGSAIFFHVSSSYTAGCTGTSTNNVVSILRWLDPSKNPVIIQCPINELANY
ncbi:MAG: L,D-transpeptidase [Clostridiaceae bacterium]